MSNVGTTAFSELAEVNPRLSLQAHSDDMLVSFIPMSDVSEGGKWTVHQERRLGDVRFGYTAFLESDLLFAKITPCMENGKGAHAVGLKSGIGCGSTEFHVLRAKGETSARYLHHWLQARTTRAKAISYMGGSAGQQRVQPQFFDRYRVPKLNPAEQRQAAAVLDQADEAIAKTEAVIAKLRQVRTGLIDELLTKAKDTAATSRLSSVALPRFSSVDKLTVSGEEPVRLCNYTDVYQNDYITADMEFMHATATPDEITQFRLQVGDVIITKDSESPDDIGIPCVIDTTAPDLLCGYHLALIRPNQALVDPTYLALQLAHHRLAAYFGQQAVGSTRYGLSVACIANAPILLPPLEEQREAGKLIRLQDAQIRQHEAELTKLQSIKSGLMDDLLTGRVPEAKP